MKRNFLILSSLLLGVGILSTSTMLVSCQKEEIKATSVSFKDGDSLTLKVGDTHVFEIEVNPSEAKSKAKFTFVDNSEEDPNEIGTLNDDGEFIANNIGTVTIKVYVDGLEDTIVVNVVPIEVESLSIDQGDFLEVEVGDEFDLTTTILPTNATNKEIIWGIKKIEGYDDRYLTIDLNGHVVCESDGFVYVTATCGNLTDEIKIHIMPTLVEVDQGDFSITFDDETHEATLSSYKGKSVAVITPSTVTNPSNGETYNVTSIGKKCFYNSQTLERIKISEGVVSIGNTAFSSCVDLYTLHYPSTLKEIGYNCFFNCKSLEDGSLPEGIEYVGMNLYNSCSSLVKATLPDSIKGCIDSKGKVDGKLQSIFVKCTSLEEAVLPKNITTIERIFSGCTNLKNFTLPDNLQRIVGSCFQNLPYLEELTLPDTVVYIGYSSISNNPNLKKINLPKSLPLYNDNDTRSRDDDVGLDPNGISGNTSLEEIHISDDSAFYKTVDGVLYTKDGSTLVCFPAKSKVKEFVASDELTTIGDNAFSYSDVVSADIKNVKNLGSNVFYHCDKLVTVNWPRAITNIPDYTFFNCSNYTGFEFYDGLTSIGKYAFYNSGIKTALLPDSITTIDSYALANIPTLKELKLPTGLTSLGSYSIIDNSALTKLTLPAKLTTLNSGALSGLSSLKEIELPEGLVSVAEGCFKGDSSLESLTIPSTVTTFKTNSNTSAENSYIFKDCLLLSEINVSEGNNKYKSIDGVLFEKNNTDETYSYLIAYPQGKTDSIYNVSDKTLLISAHAFMGNQYLNKVSINADCYTISTRSFKNTTALKEILFNKFATNPLVKRTYLSVSSGSFEGSTVRKIYYTGSYDDYSGGTLIKVSDTNLKLIYQKYDAKNPSNNFMYFNYEKTTF